MYGSLNFVFMCLQPLYKREFKARLAELSTSLSPDEIREKEKKIQRDVSQKYGRKMAKVLTTL